MHRRSVPTTTKVCFTHTAYSLHYPMPPSSSPLCLIRWMCDIRCLLARGQQQAELNCCQVCGLWPCLNIWNLPSWRQHRAGVVHFSGTKPSVRSEKDRPGETLAACRQFFLMVDSNKQWEGLPRKVQLPPNKDPWNNIYQRKTARPWSTTKEGQWHCEGSAGTSLRVCGWWNWV